MSWNFLDFPLVHAERETRYTVEVAEQELYAARAMGDRQDIASSQRVLHDAQEALTIATRNRVARYPTMY